MADMLTFFSNDSIYGPYPFFSEKYGMVAVYPYPWGGMEHQTMTTIHRSWARNGDDGGIAHELAHMWWGDMVTCLDWRNIWLNEGFATYSDELYDWHQNGLGSFKALIQERAQYYFSEEATDFHPIYDPPAGHEFDYGHSYCKGAWVQHMLRYVMGDTNWRQLGRFFTGLRAYGDSFRMASANTEDYRRVMERMSGLELGWFFDEWVYHGGYPQYTCGWHGEQTTDGWQVVINLSQNNGGQAPACFHMPVEVRVRFASGDTVIRYDVAANPQRNVFAVRAQPTSVEFDPNEWLLDEHSVQVGIDAEPAAGIPFARLNAGQNPCRGTAGLRYELPGRRNASLEVFDSQGRMVRSLIAGSMPGGRHVLRWDWTDGLGRPIPAGVYIARLTAGSEKAEAKLVLAD
jgi:aminopeptidase N